MVTILYHMLEISLSIVIFQWSILFSKFSMLFIIFFMIDKLGIYMYENFLFYGNGKIFYFFLNILTLFLITGLPKTPSEAKWLNKTLAVGSVIGVDPYLLEADTWRDLARELQGGGHSLIPVPENLIDLLWTDQPPRPAECVVPLEVLNTYFCWLYLIVFVLYLSLPCSF